MADKPIRQMQPGDLYIAPPSKWSAEAVQHKLRSMSDLDIEMKSKPSQSEYVHQKEEPDDSGSYAGGGRVRKFGSNTHVTCKSKG